jgi:hypothetical protein
VVFGELPIRGVLIASAIAVLGLLGFRFVANNFGGNVTAAPVAKVSSKPTATASASPTPVPPLKTTAPTATPRPTEPPAQPGEWFWVNDVTGGGDAVESQNIAVSVTTARFGLLAANTLSDATCVASGTYPSGAPIQASGLGQTTADASGLVRWRFVASPAERGRASYLFTCSKGSSLRTLQVLFDIP